MKNNGGFIGPFIVKFVTFEFTRLVDQNNQYYNSFKVADALVMARNNFLNLVCFNRPEGTNLAFCKIIDFNKWQYAEEKKKKKQQLESRKETKEVRLSPNIADNDIEHKMRQVNGFLDAGDDVVLVMKLRGREKAHFSAAEVRLNEILKKCENHGKEISRKKGGDIIIVRMVKGNEASKQEVINKPKEEIRDEEISNSSSRSIVSQ